MKATGKKASAASNGTKQDELVMEGMPESPLRDKLVRAWEIKQRIADDVTELKSILDDAKKDLRKLPQDKRNPMVETPTGERFRAGLKSIGESVTMTKVKVVKEKKEEKAQ